MKLEEFKKETLTKEQLLNTKGGDGSSVLPEIDENGVVLSNLAGGDGDGNGEGDSGPKIKDGMH